MNHAIIYYMFYIFQEIFHVTYSLCSVKNGFFFNGTNVKLFIR
jgi:hypothetical protein